ncbi:MAG: M23 family metallopeptidase [Chloroflexi bacterium]|nr:M23 family metallopeptidase [Chloroflexota bacterium]
MKAKSLHVLILALLISSSIFQKISAKPLNEGFILQTESISSSFTYPLGYQNRILYIPRQTYDNNGNLIEDTDYGVKNPDLDNPDTCFHYDWRELFHAGEDLYYPDRTFDAAGHEVTAVANGVVIEVTPEGWPGRGIIIEHTLPSREKIYSVYVHVDAVQVNSGDLVIEGQVLGFVIHQDYMGLFPEYHTDDTTGNTIPDSHLHFEIRYFPDARIIYSQYPDCNIDDGVGRGYTPPEIHPDNFPTLGRGYTDPTDFIDAHQFIPTPTATLPPAPAVGIPISQGSDDGGTNPGDCAFYNTDNEVYLGACFNGGNITSGFRFNNVQIPRHANIENAYINFSVDGTYTVPIAVQIFGEASGNPLTYSESSPPTNRITTFNSALWNVTDTWELGETRDTPDISSVIQEIINRPDWNSGQSISIIIKNAGSTNVRRVIGFERVSFDPDLSTAKLIITYDVNWTPTPTATPLNYTPQPVFISTSIPPTFTHIPPTPVPTNPPPTEVPWICRVCGIGCPASAQRLTVNGTGLYGTPTPYATTSTPESSSLRIAEAVDLTTLLYRVRDEILSTTPEGQRLTDLYYTYIPNIVQVLMAHPELSDQSLETMNLFVPSLEALLDGNGDTVTITSEQVAGLQSFLNALVEYGDPELQAVILSELERRPLEDMAGITMDEAWSHMNGYQLEWLPPISNSNPYSGQQGRTIPVKFTVTDFGGNFVVDESLTLQVLDANGNVVIGPFHVSNNPANGIAIQGKQYHYNLETKNLPAGSYMLEVTYNSESGIQSETRSIVLTKK